MVGLPHMSCPRPRQEEDDEEHKRQVPRMHGMGDGREEGRKDAAGRQRLLGVGAVAEQRDGWRCDDGPHGGGGGEGCGV